ncbi:MAG TPA: ribonuclease Y [Candidatus Binatia bacterium]|nr:ribonuclease Y [Candidatus Binatia bacterium]
MSSLLYVILGVMGGALGMGVVLFLRQRWAKETVAQAEDAAKLIILEAKKEAIVLKKEAEVQAKDLILQAKADFEKEVRERRKEIQQTEKRVQNREETLEKRAEGLESREAELSRRDHGLKDKEEALQQKEQVYTDLIEATRQRLEQVAEMSRDEAKRMLMDHLLEEARHEAARRIVAIEEEAREEAERRAKKVICVAVERLSGEFVAERTASIIHLPSDDMKGRIIGREGRNIRAIEAAAGVDLIVDDTPEAVLISSHSPIRREIARVALERLIADGRIHPARIEEVVKKAEQEVEEAVREAGQRAVLELGVHGLHPELLKLLGMLKYRYSYGQNVLMHSVETAYICGIMAAELGLNEKQARRVGLLHDIGKAVSHEIEGSHAIIGGEVARKYGESAKIVNAIAAHHEEVRAETVLAPLVDAADALSGARPGARRETLESYVRRLDTLERISNSFSGVEKSFALQAGREVRIIVDPGSVTDGEASMLAREVAKRIESEMTYPGQIKVTVIRETRATDFAR